MRNNSSLINTKDVLIMEDDFHTTIIYNKALARTGHSFDIARSLDEARRYLNRNTYHIFICDVQMGKECGTELLSEYKGMFASNGTKIVVASAYGNYRTMVEEMGAEFFLEKPIYLGTLFTLIDRLLHTSPQKATAAKEYYKNALID